MRVKFNKEMLIGGGAMALANHLADKQTPVLPEERRIGNSELLSAGVILGDLFLGERVQGTAAGMLNGAVAGAAYRLVDALFKPAGEYQPLAPEQAPTPETTSYPVYQEPSEYSEPVYTEPEYTEPISVSVPGEVPELAPAGGVNVLEI